MKSLIVGLIGLVLSVSVGAEPLLEGRVRLSSGQPAVGVQVRLFDLTDLRRSVGTTTDAAGHFALPLRAFSTDRGTALPTDFALGQNYPNPFNPSTIIPYQLPAAGHVRLEVFNVLGQRLATLVDAERSAGVHTAQWDGTDAAGRAVGAGVYIYRLSSGGMTESRRMVLVDGQAGIPAVGAAAPGLVRVVEGAVEADDRGYGLTVSGEGLVAYVDPVFQVGVDEADIVLEEHDGSPRMKLTTGRILGDVNNDGQVDAFDALYVLLYSEDSSITLPNNGDISLGDVNGDGQVDLADAVLLATYSVNPSDPSLPPGIGQAAPDLVPPVSETSVGQDTTLSHIYWTDRSTHKIQRANLDGSNIETLIIGDYLFWPSGLTLDIDGGKMYWTNGRKIQRANLNGSYIEPLMITGNSTSTSGPALDVTEGKMYWIDNSGHVSFEGKIRRANLDGSNIETLIITGSEAYGLALDVDGNKIYWTEAFNRNIQRANLDGSNIETLVTGLNNPEGITLDVDGNRIYWTERVSGRIQRASLDGSNIETLVTGLNLPEGITLDVVRGKMYWTAGYSQTAVGRIQRANLDGSNIETLITELNDLDDPAFVALGPYYELANPEEIQTRSRGEARSEMAERGIPYNQRSFVTYAQNGDLDLVRLFVEAGLDVNVRPYSSSSVYIPTQEDVEQLDDLEAVWFPQDGDEDNDTALMKAAGQGHIEVVRFLVEQGADLDVRNRQDQNALMFAAAGGHLAVVVFLIDRGADMSPVGFLYSYEYGPYTPLMWAAYNGQLDVVNLLLEYGDIIRISGSPGFALGWAAYRGHLDVVNLLLEYGVQLNPGRLLGKKRGSGTTALMLAAYGGHLEVVRFLLENGADIHVYTAKWLSVQTGLGTIYFQEIGGNALMLAIDQGHAEVVRLLLEHWMWEYSADGRDDYGQTALMYAAAAGDLEMARLLLENGAPVNAQTDVGTTALMFAAAFGHAEMVRFLVENGADIHIQNGYNYTALSLAEERGHQEVVDFLRSAEDAG